MVCAIVVTFNPDQTLLISQFRSLVHQVDSIVYIDNASEKEVIFPDCEKVLVIHNKKNMGLGYAQNQGFKYAQSQNCDYVLLLDQDSELECEMVASMVSELKELQSQGVCVGTICPIKESAYDGSICQEIVSLSFNIKKKGITKLTEVAYSIASGMLIPISVIKKMGGMNEIFFIDGLDLEWSCRVIYNGFKIYVTPSAKLFHRLGNGKKDRIESHSSKREYYIVRNDIYLSRLQHIPLGYRIRKKLTPFIRLGISLLHLRIEYVHSELKGIKDGYCL